MLSNLICGAIIILNLTSEPWGTQADKDVEKRAIKVCRERYAGCVKKIAKKPENTYNVTCGK